MKTFSLFLTAFVFLMHHAWAVDEKSEHHEKSEKHEKTESSQELNAPEESKEKNAKEAEAVTPSSENCKEIKLFVKSGYLADLEYKDCDGKDQAIRNIPYTFLVPTIVNAQLGSKVRVEAVTGVNATKNVAYVDVTKDQEITCIGSNTKGRCSCDSVGTVCPKAD